MSKARVLLDGLVKDCKNVGELAINLELNREDGLYMFTPELSAPLIFINDDYAYVVAQTGISVTQKVLVQVQQFAAGAWEDIFTGFFTIVNCKFYSDTCRVECNVVRDENCVIKNKEQLVNILEEPNPTTFQYVPTYGLEILFSAGGAPCNIVLPEWGSPYSLSSTCADNCLYARYVIKTRCIGGQPVEPPLAATVWALLSDDCATDNTCTFWREAKFPEVALTINSTTAIFPAIPAFCGTGEIDGGVYIVALPLPVKNVRCCVQVVNSQIPLDNGRFLVPTINFMLDTVCPGYELQSELLTNETNPITGSTANPLTDLYIYQKSDIVNANPLHDWARLGDLSIKDLFADMSLLFNAAWYADEATNKVVFEHISQIISPTVGIDLTTLDGGKWAKNKTTWTYDDTEIPKRDSYFYPSDAQGIDFYGFPIVYDLDVPSDKTNENRLSQIETEITRIINNPNESLTGFVLIATESILADDAKAENGALTNLFVPNAPLAWANLHRDYHEYYRPYVSGTLNDVPTTFLSTRPIKSQENVRFPLCRFNDFNPLERVKTFVGDGIVDSASYNIQKQFMSCTLKFEL